jgi:hypothetical protein
VSRDLTVPAAYRSQDAIDFYLQPIPEGIWKNEVTLRSTRAARMYEPGIWISRVSPTPMLMVVARDDKVTIATAAGRQRPTPPARSGACGLRARTRAQTARPNTGRPF